VADPISPRRTRDSTRSKAEILKAARAEFAEHGIAGARIERIAAAAGFNKALIYSYFESKDALFDAAFAAHVQAHMDRARFDGTDLPGYAGRLFDIFERDPAVLRLASWYRLERSTGPGLAAVIAANETRLESLRQAQRAGKLTDGFDATALLVFVQSIAGAWATLNPEFSAVSAPDRARRRKAVIDAVARLIATD
jgi:AcrR family transcriptional regulator